MFTAKIKKSWCDYCMEYVEIKKNSIEEILEYLYEIHKNSVYPETSKFFCGSGKKLRGYGGYAEVNYTLIEKFGNKGDVQLQKITYNKDGKEVIIFSRIDRYISEKTKIIFDNFSEVAKQRDENKNFGEF